MFSFKEQRSSDVRGSDTDFRTQEFVEYAT